MEMNELSPPWKHSGSMRGSKSEEVKEEVESVKEQEEVNPKISLQEFTASFFPFTLQTDIMSPLANYIEEKGANTSLILEELNGARNLEILCNRVAETFATLNSITFDPQRLPLLQKELTAVIFDLRTLFPSIALNPVLCEKWSGVFRSAVKGLQPNTNPSLTHNQIPSLALKEKEREDGSKT